MILLVGISLAVYIGLTLLSRVPHYFSYPWPITERNAAIMYRLARSMVIWLKTVIIWMFLYILWILARMATGDAVDAHPAVILLFLVALHGVVMLFIYRSYRCRHGDTTADPVAVRRPRA